MKERLFADFLILVLSLCVGVACINDDYTESGSIVITQSWSQESDYAREVPYRVYGNGGPVIIALHGMSQSGSNWFDLFENTLLPNGGNFVLFAPTAYNMTGGSTTWNAIDEGSKAPDVQFIEEIADRAADLTDICDISKGIGLIGASNGCALIIRILIESQKPELARFACYSSQLTSIQYQDTTFYAKEESGQHFSADMYYPVYPLTTGRSVWFVQGAKDSEMPPEGGPCGRLPDGVNNLGMNETGLAFSRLFGCQDPISMQASDGGSIPGTKFHSCSDSPLPVAWWLIDDGPHGMIRDEYGFWAGPNASVYKIAAQLFSMCDGCEGPADVSLIQRPRSVSSLRLRRGRSFSAM